MNNLQESIEEKQNEGKSVDEISDDLKFLIDAY